MAKKLSERDKDIFAAKWRDRQWKAEPGRRIERRGFLRKNWPLMVVGSVIIVAVVACLYSK